ncbi:MAG TPA: methyltransferase domain-containing protein, partial [Solirubrobacterales bacterium]|nr:methyltransferase domain-containing protein [Solirubrobacterales bacterium]
AGSYHRVSVPHEEWARSVLDRLPLAGDETVLDAGCGSGRVTRMLIERLPRGRVIAVDGSPSMVEKVREVLRPGDEALVSDLTSLELDEPVDAVFSSAVFHWVLDHDLLFRRLAPVLRPGGALAAQCGGAGNIDRLRTISDEVAASEPFAPYFEGFDSPWNYAGAEESEARLGAAGFEDVRCWLQPWTIEPPEPAEFLRTVCLGPHVDRLPEDLRAPFIGQVLAAEPEPLQLEYVRLNIEARVPSR